MRMEATRSKFDIDFSVIENGSGTFQGALEDIDLPEGATVNWVAPRRVLKVSPKLHIKPRMVIQSRMGIKYMVAGLSPSETSMGSPFTAFRLYQVTGVSQLVTRTTTVDVRTGLEKEGVPSDPINIYVSYEPLQEAFDRELRIPNEKHRIITNYPLNRGDLVDGETVIEVNDAIGLSGAVLG